MARNQKYQRRRASRLLGGVSATLKSIGELRDGLLIVASTVYIVGYLVWSFNAWLNHWGLLPALDPQYLVAGIVPLFILALGVVLFGVLRRFLTEVWPGLVGQEAKGRWRFVRVLLLLLVWGSLLLFLFGPITLAFMLLVYIGDLLIKRFLPASKDTTTGQSRTLRPLEWLYAVVFVLLLLRKDDLLNAIIPQYRASQVQEILMDVFVLGIIFMPPAGSSKWFSDRFGLKLGGFDWLSDLYRKLLVFIVVPIIVFLGVFYSFLVLYPSLPQEFGGVLPRCAYLDVVKAQVSDKTLADSVPIAAINSNQPVVRSLAVEVLYTGSDVMLIRLQGRVYRLAKNSIQAVIDCN